MSTLRHFYDDSLLKDLHPFTSSGIYVSPPEGPYQSYVDYIKSLPTSEAPDVFGMHENANITFQLQESTKILNTMLGMQPRATSSKGGKTPDEIVSELAAKILAGLPAPLRPEDSKTANIVGPTRAVSSLTTVLFQVLHVYTKHADIVDQQNFLYLVSCSPGSFLINKLHDFHFAGIRKIQQAVKQTTIHPGRTTESNQGACGYVCGFGGHV